MMSDNINPDHYKNETSLECIEAMQIAFGRERVLTFCMLNAFKYIWRWKNKNGEEDLNKASWYVSRARDILNDPETSPNAIGYKVIVEMECYIEKQLSDMERVDEDGNS